MFYRFVSGFAITRRGGDGSFSKFLVIRILRICGTASEMHLVEKFALKDSTVCSSFVEATIRMMEQFDSKMRQAKAQRRCKEPVASIPYGFDRLLGRDFIVVHV
jgi:hypothetical protein